MRALLWPFLICLAACDGAEQQTSATASAAPEDRIECALGGEQAFIAECAIERADDILTLRHADGGFRRLVITDDGRGVVAADGSVPAEVKVIANNRIEVKLDEDRYRLPATVRAP